MPDATNEGSATAPEDVDMNEDNAAEVAGGRPGRNPRASEAERVGPLAVDGGPGDRAPGKRWYQRPEVVVPVIAIAVLVVGLAVGLSLGCVFKGCSTKHAVSLNSLPDITSARLIARAKNATDGGSVASILGILIKQAVESAVQLPLFDGKSLQELFPDLTDKIDAYLDQYIRLANDIEILDFLSPEVLQAVLGLLRLLPTVPDQIDFAVMDFAIRDGGDLSLSLAPLEDSQSLSNLTSAALAEELAQLLGASPVLAPSGGSELLAELQGQGQGQMEAGTAAAMGGAGSGGSSTGGGSTAGAGSSSQTMQDLTDLLAAAAKELLLGPAPPDGLQADGGPGGSADLPWHLRKIGVDKAWDITQGRPEVVVAILDSGFDISHPAIAPSLWVNRNESGANATNGRDDDGNKYVDDTYGYDFAGSCASDWRQPPPPAPPPAPRPRPPAPRPPPPRPPGSAPPPPPAQTCKAGDNDVSPEPGVRNMDHGTHVAGIVAAVFNKTAGVYGAAPLVKLMLLKVFGATNLVYASNVIAAYAYAQMMGAHILVCSFGPDARSLDPTLTLSPDQLSQMASQQRAYAAAVQPLSDKGVLVVAAAGNEQRDLDPIVAANRTYLPCSLDSPALLCVTATDPQDRLAYGWDEQGPTTANWGVNTIHIAAPGWNIPSTLPASLNYYGNRTGSSMAAPLVAAVAALGASVVGRASAPPNYFQGPLVKDLVLGSADAVPDLPVRNNRRVNALRAVLAAAALANGSYLLNPSTTFHMYYSGSASLLASGPREEYFAASPLAAGAAPGAANASWAGIVLPQLPLYSAARFSSANVSATRLDAYALNASASPSGLLVLRLSGLLSLPDSGTWGLQVRSAMPRSRMRLSIGQRRINLTASSGPDPTITTIRLTALQPGMYYDFEMLVLNPAQPLELRVSAPSSPANFTAPPPFMFLVPSYERAIYPRHAPNVSLSFAPDSPPGWHIAWEYAVRSGSQQALRPALLASFSAGLPPLTGPFVPMRNAALRPQLFPAPGSLGAAVQATVQQALASPTASPNITQPDPATTGAYGVALAHLRLPWAESRELQLRVVCSSCVLFLQGVPLINASQSLPLGSAAQQPAPLTAPSGCVRLTAGGAGSGAAADPVFTLELRFAVGDLSAGSSTSVLDVQYANCSGGRPTGQWAALGPLLTSALMWAPPPNSTAVRTNAMRCDLWTASNDSYVVPSAREVPPLASALLPNRTSYYQRCGYYVGKPNCTGLAQLTPQEIKPDIATDGDSNYHVRCWAFWGGSFRQGLVTMRVDADAPPTAATYLGGQTVFRSFRNDDPNGGSFPPNYTRVSLAPLASSPGPYLRLLAWEYARVAATDVLSLRDGTVASQDRFLLQFSDAMALPLA